MNFLEMFKGKSRSVIGVDIGSSSIKIVQLKNEKGVAVLETYGELALGPYGGVEIGRAANLSVDKLAEAIKDLIKEASITTVSSGFSIPLSSSLLTFIQMPAVDTKELNKMIPIEARKYIPVPISEVMLDWFIMPTNSGIKEMSKKEEVKEEVKEVNIGKTDVLLVAIHNEILNNYNTIVEKSNLDADFFEIEIFSTIRSVLDQNVAPAMIIDIGAAATKVYVVEQGIIRVSHIINRGSQDITLGISKSLKVDINKAEEIKRSKDLNKKLSENADLKQVVLLTLDYIFSEANRVLLNYQKKYNKTVNHAVLTGGGSVMKGVGDFAQEHLETETSIGDPFSKIQAPAFLEDVLKEAGPEFSVAVGLALRKLQDLDA